MYEKTAENRVTRTDLAVENLQDITASKTENDGYKTEIKENEASVVTVIDILNGKGEKLFDKPKGRYVTVEVPPFGKDGEVTDDRLFSLCDELKKLLPDDGDILVAGLGNRDITADALGPLVTSQILATRHLNSRITENIGLSGLRSVSTIAPGVLGQTGIEISDVIKSISELVSPSAIISVDALAARELSRLGCTVQITDAGVAPGSGIGNQRPQISRDTIGIPVISIGVPTVISVESLLESTFPQAKPYEQHTDRQTEQQSKSYTEQQSELHTDQQTKQHTEQQSKLHTEQHTDRQAEITREESFSGLIVTPKDIDLLVSRAAKLISLAINTCLFPEFSIGDILNLTG